jgi:hypothetical protein
VDYAPFDGDYTGSVVRDNVILGGFATSTEQPGEVKGVNQDDVIIKYALSH